MCASEEARVPVHATRGCMVTLKKILFPTDFSSNANHALSHAIRLTRFNKGELIVQHVVSTYFEGYPHWSTLFDLHELQKHMDNYVDQQMPRILPDDMAEIRIRNVISRGKPAEEIAALAQKELADLVVMGSARGVITAKVIRLTNRPVMAITMHGPGNTGDALRPVRRILVATDFSEHSKQVLQYAFELKQMFNAAIYMLYVIEPMKAVRFGLQQAYFTGRVEKMKQWAENQLVNLTPDEFMDDPAVFRIIDTGTPGDCIASVADNIGADITILGTHEYGTIHRHLLGTTTGKLLTRTSRPVLAVKL